MPEFKNQFVEKDNKKKYRYYMLLHSRNLNPDCSFNYQTINQYNCVDNAQPEVKKLPVSGYISPMIEDLEPTDPITLPEYDGEFRQKGIYFKPLKQEPEMVVIETEHALFSEEDSLEKNKYYDNNRIKLSYNDEQKLTEIELNEGNDVTVVAYRRKIGNKHAWASNINHQLNKDLYFKLTGDLTCNHRNAQKIANLFQHYVATSGLKHGHMFRHDESIAMAKKITENLNMKSFKDNDVQNLVLYLVRRLDDMVLDPWGYQLQPNGEFYRRLSYVILQLSEGFSHSPPDVEQYLEQFHLQLDRNCNPDFGYL